MKQFILLCMVAALAACKGTGIDARDALVGTWDVTDACLNDTLNYVIELEEVGGKNKMRLMGDGLYSAGLRTDMVVTGSRIILNLQQLVIQESSPKILLEFAGSGTVLSSDSLRLEYTALTVQDDLITSEDTCVAIFRKR